MGLKVPTFYVNRRKNARSCKSAKNHEVYMYIGLVAVDLVVVGLDYTYPITTTYLNIATYATGSSGYFLFECWPKLWLVVFANRYFPNTTFLNKTQL